MTSGLKQLDDEDLPYAHTLEINFRFHRKLIEISGNVLMQNLMEVIYEFVLTQLKLRTERPTERRRDIPPIKRKTARRKSVKKMNARRCSCVFIFLPPFSCHNSSRPANRRRKCLCPSFHSTVLRRRRESTQPGHIWLATSVSTSPRRHFPLRPLPCLKPLLLRIAACRQ